MEASGRDAARATSEILNLTPVFDDTAPDSTAGPVPATSSGASIAVPFVAADDHLGPLTVELWVRHRASDGDPPPPFSKVVQSSSSPLTYTFPHGDGAYEFATVAVGPSLDIKPRGGNGDSWLLLYSHTSPVGTPPEQLDPYRERGIGDRSLIGSGRVSE